MQLKCVLFVKKRNQKNQYQQRPKTFTPPRQLGIPFKYAKVASSDAIYREADIELRSFVNYDQEGNIKGKYIKLLENRNTLNTFDRIADAEKSFLDTINNRVQDGWVLIKADRQLSRSNFIVNK